MRYWLLLCYLIPAAAVAQDSSTLPQVIIHAFEKYQPIRKIPAAVSITDSALLSRSENFSLTGAVNSLPGVRLEERSPGSYRVNIRASSLRSPFGVRNIKVYLNDLPFTEPGGHTFFNQLGFYNVASLEIIRGPASSMYGAGTGGAMLIKTMANQPSGLYGSYSAGSFATNNFYLRAVSGSKKANHLAGYQHQQSNGYRLHSELKRQVFNYTSDFKLKSGTFQTTFLYGNLFYETPGALNLQGYLANPRGFRPASPVFPSAESARASVKQQMIFGGAGIQLKMSSTIQNRTGIYGMYTTLRNPNIQGYDASDEPHHGVRTVFSYKRRKALELDAGVEYQKGKPIVSAFSNNAGKPGEVRSVDEIHNRRLMVFLQASYEWKEWQLNFSGSYNSLFVETNRTTGPGLSLPLIKFTEYAPSISLLKDFGNFSIYSGISRGFSPPTIQEILPSGGELNPLLQAESGSNFQLGSRGSKNRISWDINVFYYTLKNTLVQRRTAGGGDYYINAGATKQAGSELQLSFRLNNSFLNKGSQFRINYTFYDFKYRDFSGVDDDFSGNKMPSVPDHSINAIADLIRGPFSLLLQYEFLSRVPLNDANDAFADAAEIFGIRLGWSPGIIQKPTIFVAISNFFDERYSLGNDFNGFGGRYYNAAPGRNYSAGISFNIPWQ